MTRSLADPLHFRGIGTLAVPIRFPLARGPTYRDLVSKITKSLFSGLQAGWNDLRGKVTPQFGQRRGGCARCT